MIRAQKIKLAENMTLVGGANGIASEQSAGSVGIDIHNLSTTVTPTITSAGSDLLAISDESASGDPTGKATLFSVLTAAAGDGLAQNATTGALKQDVHNLGTTVATPVITAAGSDLVAISDESAAGDPTGKASLFSILTAAAGEGLAQDGTSGALTMAAATQDRIVYLTATSADQADGTADITVQAKDGAGNNLAANTLIKFWTGTANDFGQDAVTDITATTGTLVREVVANAEQDIVTNASGVAVISVTNAAGTVYGWAAVGGKVTAVTIVITGP